MDVEPAELSKTAPILHIEIVSRRALFNDDMVDVWSQASGSCSHIEDNHLEDGVIYDIKMSLALRGLDLSKVPEHDIMSSC